MSKYDFSLDMNSVNSNSCILKHIAPNSKVLELGCAHGRMTQYLKQNLNCEVTICELDDEAGKIAAQWADCSFVGSDGDIEADNFFSQLKKSYDYIIFADVLEHLKYPFKVLNNCKNVLSKNGSIWISIPNVAHNSILIDLWNNKFTYRTLGLLDNTHLRFFTIDSLTEMVYKAGLTIHTAINLDNIVENTEFNNSYDDVPPTVAMLMKRREHAETYQFVWELKKSK